MKFFSQLATITTTLVFSNSTLAVSCGSSGSTKTSDVRLLRNDLASNGQNHSVSSLGTSQFNQLGSASLTLEFIGGLPMSSTHAAASTVGAIVQAIIDVCCQGDMCCEIMLQAIKAILSIPIFTAELTRQANFKLDRDQGV